jgi:transcriptional regulator GlxA family with amidase domain
MSAVNQERVKAGFDGEVTEQRLDHAKFLLTQTNAPLETIAAGCGWENEASFAVVFREKVGVAPLHYRDWHHCRR